VPKRAIIVRFKAQCRVVAFIYININGYDCPPDLKTIFVMRITDVLQRDDGVQNGVFPA
jgi:hypothetical protein